MLGCTIFVAHRKSRPPEAKHLGVYLNWSYRIVGLTYLIATVLAITIEKNWIIYGQYASISLMLLPIAYLYTTHRFRLLDYHPIIKRSRVYAIVSVAINVLMVLLLVFGVANIPRININYPGIWFTERSIEVRFLDDLPPEKREQWKIKAAAVATILFVLLLWQLRRLLQSLIARKFYQEKYDYKKALAEFSGIVACCLDRRHLTNEVVHKLSGMMHLKNIGIALADNGKLIPSDTYGFAGEEWQKMNLQTDSLWLKQLTTDGHPCSLENIHPEDKIFFKDLGASFLAPITLNGRLLGLFILGEKLSEDHYRLEDIELLEAAASQTAVALENVNLYQELREQDRLRNELRIAHKIQLGSLPKNVPDMPGLSIFGISKPATEVGGDYYDFFRYDEKQLMTVVGDVSGKGTSAALYVAKIQGIMRSIYEYHPSPANLFCKLNEHLYGDIEKNFFITQLGVKFDLKKKKAIVARAGHEPVLHFNAKENSVRFVESRGLGLCLTSPHEFTQSLEEITMPLYSGDIFVLFTDGITEADNGQGVEFGERRLLNTLRSLSAQNVDQIGNGIIEAAEEFSDNGRQFDDLTICVVKVD
jgi:serine phosphatase RsbU (regulator of sigma subunit)